MDHTSSDIPDLPVDGDKADRPRTGIILLCAQAVKAVNSRAEKEQCQDFNLLTQFFHGIAAFVTLTPSVAH